MIGQMPTSSATTWREPSCFAPRAATPGCLSPVVYKVAGAFKVVPLLAAGLVEVLPTSHSDLPARPDFPGT